MAVNLDESKYFKFVIISDKSKPLKKNFTEKPIKDKDNMSTESSATTHPNNNTNEKSMDEKNQNSQEANKQAVPEVKVNDTPNNTDEGESTMEQKNEEKLASRSVQNNLSIEVPKGVSPQLVTSPSEITGAKAPELSTSPISPPQNSNIFKKIGNMIRSSPDNTVSNTIPEQGEVTTSDSKVQTQQERQVADNAVVNNNIAENTVNAERSDDENQKKDDKKGIPETASKQRTTSLSSLANVKMFITRTSSVLVEKLKEEFDNLDKRIYPDIDPDYQAKLSREAGISEREQLLENKDISYIPKESEITNGTSQKSQSTKDVMADVGIALNERKERLDNIGERTEELSNNAASFAEMAAEIRRNQEQKSKLFGLW
ncbi:hypothetical protein C1645_87446 [Glomus cerebriforme]|uniref:V-SNARE coiled-coil homology domain-containing protein n=1 Tax=Glomus cerebriforme TaxID=658196 RepID=A0A397T746_9GLOM|nr:hypothetical protein C1645_87446 [Glomus cerebriforme]